MFICSTDFSLLNSLDFQSISVEAFGFGGDQFVVFAQPFIDRCSFMEWDHVQMEFRNFDNITSKPTALEMLCACLSLRIIIHTILFPDRSTSFLGLPSTKEFSDRLIRTFILINHIIHNNEP